MEMLVQSGEDPQVRSFAPPLRLLVRRGEADDASWVPAAAYAARGGQTGGVELLVVASGQPWGAARWVPRGSVRLFPRDA